MPFETVPIKLSPEEFEREIMIKFLVKHFKGKEFTLKNMSLNILRGYYKMGKYIRGKNEKAA